MPEKATPKPPPKTARKVRGHYTTYYALEKPPIAALRHGAIVTAAAGKRLNKVGTNDPVNGTSASELWPRQDKNRLQELSKSPNIRSNAPNRTGSANGKMN